MQSANVSCCPFRPVKFSPVSEISLAKVVSFQGEAGQLAGGLHVRIANDLTRFCQNN